MNTVISFCCVQELNEIPTRNHLNIFPSSHPFAVIKFLFFPAAYWFFMLSVSSFRFILKPVRLWRLFPDTIGRALGLLLSSSIFVNPVDIFLNRLSSRLNSKKRTVLCETNTGMYWRCPSIFHCGKLLRWYLGQTTEKFSIRVNRRIHYCEATNPTSRVG